MFCECFSLKSLPDITEWDFSHVKKMRNMFYKCLSLTSFPNSDKLDKKVKHETEVIDIFDGCDSLK